MADDRRNLVITGFMGTGKSTVARAVAQRMGRACVDMDEEIVRRAGMTIALLFETRGEQVFRDYERALCEELAARERLVIATGGGALVDPLNRELLARNGLVVCLGCAEWMLVERLRGDTRRPMLHGADPEQRLRELLQARRAAYAEAPHHIDTTDKPVKAVAAEVVTLFESRPRVWRVQAPQGDYPVHLAPGVLGRLAPMLRVRGVAERVVVVSDAHVWPLYGEGVVEGLRAGGFDPAPVVLPAGEQTKTLESVRVLYDAFIEAGLDRHGAVIALGGGVITDMAGLAAATYLRGVPLVQAPTTLLGMVDAGVGGKVAVDHPQGKNLIGAFVTPLLVLVDPDVLDTLPKVERLAGLAEIIKAGVIADAELFGAFAPERTTPDLRWAVERALEVKIAVVERDPYEQGERAVLNLGHTFAHAFERLAEYSLAHGLAVSVGMVAAAELAALRGVCSPSTVARLRAVLAHQGLPTRYDAHPPDVVYQAMGTDKKRQGARLRFVLPRDIGEVVIDGDVPPEQVIAALERIRT
ncbi:MAG: 3-dehydroquinate synthase [Anaerolineae bacterium]